MNQLPIPMEKIPVLFSLFIDERCKAFMRAIWRKLEAVAVLIYVFCGVVWPVLCALTWILCLFSPFFPIAALYGYWFYRDFKTPERGSRERLGIRDWYVWRLIANYFPIKIVKTADLLPENNYIIGCHPHGFGCFGTFISLCTNGNDFPSYFPGIKSTVATMNGMFYFPLRREQLMYFGVIAVSDESLGYYLDGDKGKAVGVVVGGAEEFLDAHPRTHNLTLKRRKGFVRVALKRGAHLVPMYCFGENDIYSQLPNKPGSWIRTIQSFIKKFLHWSPTLVYGNFWCGIMPKRKPINCVFGRPIPVAKNSNPSEAEVDEVHRKYCDELRKLFDEHKAKFGVGNDEHIHFK